jgi:hypothetical protein
MGQVCVLAVRVDRDVRHLLGLVCEPELGHELQLAGFSGARQVTRERTVLLARMGSGDGGNRQRRPDGDN